MLFKKLKLVPPWIWKHSMFPGRKILTTFPFLPFKTFFMLKFSNFIFRNWNLWVWKRHKAISFSSSNLYPLKMCKALKWSLQGLNYLQVELHWHRLLRWWEQWEHFTTVGILELGISKWVLMWACRTSCSRRILVCSYNCTCSNN